VALYPNVRRDIIGLIPTNIYGYPTMRMLNGVPQKNLAYFGNENIASTSSIPEGAFEGRACILAPITSGAMASGDNETTISFALSGNVLSGGAMDGDGDITFSQTGGLSLVVSLDGTSTITLTGDTSNLALTVGLSGEGTWTITGNSSLLAMLVPCEGSGTITITGDSDLKGLLSLEGESTPFTELSPQSLAQAVWEYVGEDAFTTADLLRLIAAVSQGNATGLDTNPVFKSIDGSKTRVAGTRSGGNRTITTRDAT
jgi:hypothetical protein